MTQQERFAAMFAAIDAESKRYVLAILRAEYERANWLRRPTLRLIQGGPPVATPCKARAAARTKKTESA